jgi:4-carboxymuconolactone decarboxylase
MARIPYADPAAAGAATRDALDALPPLHVFRMLAHADSALVPWLGLAGTLLAGLDLDPRLRELAILLVARRSDAEYEWIQHVGIATALGIPAAEIDAVHAGDLDAPCLDDDARAVLRFTAQALDRPRVDDATFAALAARLPHRQIVELLLVVGSYRTLARLMTTLDLDLDDPIGSTVVDEAARRRARGDLGR